MSERDISRAADGAAAQTAAQAADAFRQELGPQSNTGEAGKGAATAQDAATKTPEQKTSEQNARPDVPPHIPIPPPPRFPDPWCRFPWDPLCPQKPDPLPDFPPKEKDKEKDQPKKPKK